MMKNFFLILLIILTFSCDKEDITNPNILYGFSYPYFSPFQPIDADSIIEFDFSTGNYKSIWAVKNFKGLGSCRTYVRSKKLDLLAYNIGGFEIGFLDLKKGDLKRLSYDDDSTNVGIGSLEIDEDTDRLFSICTYFNYSTKEYTLGVDEIDLQTLEIMKKHTIAKATNERVFLSDIDSKNNTLYIISPSEKILFIFNYLTEEVITKQLEEKFEDIHYYNNTLIGTSDFRLISYSLKSYSSTVIGKYPGLNAFIVNCSFFNKASETYWLGTINLENKDRIDLVNINLKNAAIDKRINLSKPIQKFN